jgi:hypothetical protein
MLLIAGIRIAMPVVLSITMAIVPINSPNMFFILFLWARLPTYFCHSIRLMHVYGQGHLGLADSKVGVILVIMKLFD